MILWLQTKNYDDLISLKIFTLRTGARNCLSSFSARLIILSLLLLPQRKFKFSSKKETKYFSMVSCAARQLLPNRRGILLTLVRAPAYCFVFERFQVLHIYNCINLLNKNNFRIDNWCGINVIETVNFYSFYVKFDKLSLIETSLTRSLGDLWSSKRLNNKVSDEELKCYHLCGNQASDNWTAHYLATHVSRCNQKDLHS